MEIKYNTREPRYTQIVRYFINQIVNGTLSPGEKLPSRRELASKIGVNANTVQRALSELELHGLIFTLSGKPSVIQSDRSRIREIRTSLINDTLDNLFDEISSLNVDYDELVTLIKEKYRDKS